MQAIIPNTLEGALILSVIDFFLSFIIIAGIGVVLSLFPYINRFGPQQNDQPSGYGEDGLAQAALAQPDTLNEHQVLAISAAVYAVAGPHRIIHIESSTKEPRASHRA